MTAVHAAADYGHDPQDGGPWLAVCPHGNTAHGQTADDAARWADDPAAWCGACADEEGQPMSDTLAQAAKRYAAARARERAARDALRAEVLAAVDAGMTEVQAAAVAGVDRMTVRAWLGKRP